MPTGFTVAYMWRRGRWVNTLRLEQNDQRLADTDGKLFWTRTFVIWFMFHRVLFPLVQLKVIHNWLRWSLGADQLISHYLYQCWRQFHDVISCHQLHKWNYWYNSFTTKHIRAVLHVSIYNDLHVNLYEFWRRLIWYYIIIMGSLLKLWFISDCKISEHTIFWNDINKFVTGVIKVEWYSIKCLFSLICHCNWKWIRTVDTPNTVYPIKYARVLPCLCFYGAQIGQSFVDPWSVFTPIIYSSWDTSLPQCQW